MLVKENCLERSSMVWRQGGMVRGGRMARNVLVGAADLRGALTLLSSI